uniref:Protein NATD1 n=1 Tax=Vombatus ursinus TaxID=29139 RepID=A0A4X2LNT9_VOMUR
MAHSAQLNILEQNCPIQVEHDRKRRQFTVKLNGCHDRAVLLYEYVGKRIVDLQHTEVPDAYRGRGIAKHLAKIFITSLSFKAGSQETRISGLSPTPPFEQSGMLSNQSSPMRKVLCKWSCEPRITDAIQTNQSINID